MSYPINATVQVKGGAGLADFRSLRVSQFVFTHHEFALDYSFEALGRALGLSPEAVYTRAHEQLIGKEVAIAWQSGLPEGGSVGTFEFSGVILETSIRTDSDLLNYYHISGHSATYLLEDGIQTRAFRHQSVQDIFQTVLAPYPDNIFRRQLKAQHTDILPYVVQYQESNYQFLARLAACHGEWFYHDGQTLHLGASPQSAAIRFQANSSQAFALAMRLRPTGLQEAHYSYRTHEPLQTKAVLPTGGHAYSQFAVRQSAAIFTQPHRLRGDVAVVTQAQLQHTADKAAARSTRALVTLEGQGELFGLTPGALLDVYDAAQAGYGEFRVLAVWHSVDGDGNYSNRFEAQPGAEALPPPHPLPPVPTAQPELAEVIDLQDPRHLGRVRVRFYWDVQQPADAESGWLRVSTPYSGDGKGQLFTPERGSQVLVGYEHGLADFPVVLGNLFHPQNPQAASYSTPNNHLKGLQTAGGNKFVMVDTAGAQSVLISNSNRKSTSLLISFAGDGSVSIATKGPINLTSGDTISLEAKKNISLRAGEDILISAGKNISVGAEKENITMRAQKEVLIAASSGDLTLEADTKKVHVKAQDNVEVAASAVAKIMGREIKMSES